MGWFITVLPSSTDVASIKLNHLIADGQGDILITSIGLYLNDPYIRLYSKNVSAFTNSRFTTDDVYLFTATDDKNKKIIQTKMSFMTMYWSYELEAFVIQFMILSARAAKTIIEVSLEISKTGYTYYDILKAICKKIDIKLRTCSTLAESEDIKGKIKLYPSYHGIGEAATLIREVCKDNLLEYFFYDNYLEFTHLAIVYSKDISYIKNERSTISRFTINNTTIKGVESVGIYVGACGADNCLVPIPGRLIRIYVQQDIETYDESRIVWQSYHWSQGGSKTSFVSTLAKISMGDFMNVIPPAFKEEINFTYPNYLGYVSKASSTASEYEHTDLALINNSNDPTSQKTTNLTDMLNKRVVRSSPYAGKDVGLQFPDEKDAVEMIVSPQDSQDMGVAVGQIFQKTQPFRSSSKDFRLTLPNATIYIKENGEIIIAGDKIYIGNTPSLSPKSTPSISDAQYIALYDHTHPMANHIHTTPNGPSGPAQPSNTQPLGDGKRTTNTKAN
jgi:hypothetical protein